jgi:hypothetical protein
MEYAYSTMPSERDLKDEHDYWVDRSIYKVPRHLVGIYDQGRISADALCAIADLFKDEDDYERVKASGLSDSVDRDTRYDEAVLRLAELESSST